MKVKTLVALAAAGIAGYIIYKLKKNDSIEKVLVCKNMNNNSESSIDCDTEVYEENVVY